MQAISCKEGVAVAASMLAALLARDLHARLERLVENTAVAANDTARDAVPPCAAATAP
ncbi:hypothetical protein WME75_24475 [Sorangium sp. So ce1014]|uniref:hypothetical protein n=1 Tax=Sorangium sp. So ce1014 TaxID=3133326 RepID=UPI003F61BCEC